MTDANNLHLDLSVRQPLSYRQQPELYAFDDCKAYILQDNNLLIRNPKSNKSAIIMPEVLAALRLCQQFLTLDQHTAAIEQGMPRLRGQTEEIRQVLDSMIRDGMLISATSWCDDFNSSEMEAQQAAEPAAVVAVITCDRPAALHRLLQSISENGDQAGFEYLYVIDDSRDTDNIERNREAVAHFNSESPIECSYFGRDHQRQLMSKLISLQPGSEEAIRFLIDFERWQDEWTGGLARNFAMLLSSGRRLVMLDDDALFQVYEPRPRPLGVIFGSDNREAQFFENEGDWPGLKLRPDLDPVKAHLHCLGLPLQRALSRLGVNALLPEHLEGCTVLELYQLRAESPILVTQCGSLGDPGIGTNTWLIDLTGESRQNMLASEESVGHAISNHNAWIGRKRPHIAKRSNMSLITGLDNRKPLPPYFPINRSEDRLFGIMIGALFPNAAVLDYPWASPHLPLEKRDLSAQQPGFKGKSTFPRFYVEWLNGQEINSEPLDTADRYDLLAMKFFEMSGLQEEELIELHRDYQVQKACKDLVDLQSALESRDELPQSWSTFVENGLRQINADLTRILTGAESAQERVPTEAIEVWRANWKHYGDAIKVWPELMRLVSDDSSVAVEDAGGHQ